MSSDKTESRSLAIIPRTIDECTDLAERFSKSTLLPKAMHGKMPDVLVTIMAGQELGLSPMASLRSIHVIEGKPVLSADGMVAIILGSGKAVYFERVEESDTSVTYETLRVGAKSPRRCTWTMAMAKAAALHLKDNWRGYPRAMLSGRAKAELARDVYPDVLAGCYTTEEAEAFSGPRPEYQSPPSREPEAVDAEIVEPGAEMIAEINGAETASALTALAPKVNKLAKGSAERIAAMAAFKARQGSFAQPAIPNSVHAEAAATP